MTPEVKSIMRVLCGEARWQIWWAVRQERMTMADAGAMFSKSEEAARSEVRKVDAIIKKIRAAKEDASI